MLIKKRWAWLTSVVLLGFLARADGYERDSSSSIVEAPIVDRSKRDILQEPIHKTIDKCVKTEDFSVVSIPIEAKSTVSMEEAEPEKDLKALSFGDKPVVTPQAFPYAIDSPPSIAHVSAMLSFCVYHSTLSVKECKEFWEHSCDKESFHQFQFNEMNVMTVCKNDGRVYVALAGSQSWSDGAVDASVLSREVRPSRKGFFGHGGFVARSREYSSWMNEKLSSIQDIHQREIILTGHSLGAALATILAHDVYEGLDLRVHGGVTNALNQVKVIGFGSPSTLLDPSAYFLGHLNHIRFHNPHDPVATTLASASGYSHVGVELVIPDRPARHIARASPLLNKQMSLRLLRHLPISYWNSLPPLPRSRLDVGFDAHYMDSYAILADSTLAESQRQRSRDRSLTSLVNAERTISKRLGAPVVCRSDNDRVICSSQGKVVAKFRYALDAPSTEHQMDVCMSDIVSANFVPGVTANAGISVGGRMLPDVTASEALILDISEGDKWYHAIPSPTFASLYLDGQSPLPKTCNREPTFLEASRTLPSERALIRKFIDAPRMFNVTRNYLIPPNETVDLVQADPGFFDDSTRNEGRWMDCRLLTNSPFCPASCKDNQACAMMKYWSTDADGTNYWVSLSKSSGIKWNDDGNSWKYTIAEKRTSWFSVWRSQSQATFMVVRSEEEESEGQSQ